MTSFQMVSTDIAKDPFKAIAGGRMQGKHKVRPGAFWATDEKKCLGKRRGYVIKSAKN